MILIIYLMNISDLEGRDQKAGQLVVVKYIKIFKLRSGYSKISPFF